MVSGNVYCQVGAKLQKQALVKANGFTVERNNLATPVKNQAMTRTCWSFSTSSLIESQFMKSKGPEEIDLSEMFTVYNIYVEKAKNYLLRQGKAQFSEGGLGHDLIRSYSSYGAMPDAAFSGLKGDEKLLNHSKLAIILKEYLDSLLKHPPIAATWMEGYKKLLNDAMGTPPADFEYNSKRYTPKTFATEILKFSSKDYVNITSFTHHFYYQPFILEVPDNFSNGSYYNLPLKEMIQLVETAVRKGYTILWDADVSNSGFLYKQGLGLFIDRDNRESLEPVTADEKELVWNADIRQEYFENLTTQDDHLMQITGIEKTRTGKEFFLVKNSWGTNGPYQGYVNISEAYFAINTISLIVPKQAIDPAILLKLGIK